MSPLEFYLLISIILGVIFGAIFRNYKLTDLIKVCIILGIANLFSTILSYFLVQIHIPFIMALLLPLAIVAAAIEAIFNKSVNINEIITAICIILVTSLLLTYANIPILVFRANFSILRALLFIPLEISLTIVSAYLARAIEAAK